MDTLIKTPETVVTSPSDDTVACGGQDVRNPSTSFSRRNNAHRFAMLSPPAELDLRSLPSTPLEYAPYNPSPLSAVNEDAPPIPLPKSPRSPSGPFPFPSTSHRRKTSTASHIQYPRTSVASTNSNTSGASSSMPPLPARSPLRRPSAKSTASFTGLLKEFDLAPNSPLPLSPASAYSTTTNGSPDPNFSQFGRAPPNRPLPRRPSDASQISNASVSSETLLNSTPSLVSFATTLTPETSNGANGSTPPAPSKPKRKHALLELLSSERAYAADLALVRDIYIPLSRGLPSPFEPPSSIPAPSNAIGSVNHAPGPSSSPRSSTHTSSSARTSASGSTAASSINLADLPMPPDASKIVFGNIEEIAVFSDRLTNRLEEALGNVLEGGEGEDRVGELFLEVIPIMSPLYKAYITRHPTALAQFQSLPPCPALTNYLTQTRALTTALTNAWDIPSLLIKPVQRLLKYPLLLNTIFTETPDDHGDKAKLLEAKQSIEEVARMVNEGRRRWEVVKAVLSQGKANSSANGPAQAVGASRGGAPKLSRMKSLRTKMRSTTSDNGELDRGREELERWERRIRECEMVVKELARHTLEWNREVDVSLKRLKGWNTGFGTVVGLGVEGVEAVGAFGKVVTGIQQLTSDFHKIVQTVYLPQLSTLLRTLTSPRTLLAHMHTLRHSHVTLLNTPYNKSRPPSALIEASNDYLALQATLREELPKYIALFEKGLAVLLLEFTKWQKDLWREVKERWVSFWLALAVEGETGEEGALACIGSGAGETMKIWKERFEEVELALTMFRITTRPSKTQMSRGYTQESVYRQSNGSSMSMLDHPPTSVYQHSRSQSAHDLLGNAPRNGPSQSWESIDHQLNNSSSRSTPSLHSRHKRNGSAATEASIPPPPPMPHAEMAAASPSMVGLPTMFTPKKERSKSREERQPRTAKKEGKLRKDGRVHSEPVAVPRLVEPFGQEYAVGKALAPPPSPVPSFSPTSPREKSKGKDKDRGKFKDKDDTSSLRATSPRPFRRRLTDSLFGLPRSSSHGRSKSLTSDPEVDLKPEGPLEEGSHKTTHGQATPARSSFLPLPPLSLGSEIFSVPAPFPSPLQPPTSPLYSCTTIVPFLPLTKAKYMDLPMLKLHVGDTIQVLFEAGHPSEHELPIFVDDGDDCLLVAQDEAGCIGWVLASFVVPLA